MVYLSCPRMHLYSRPHLCAGAEMSAAGPSVGKQESFTFPQRGFQHGGESLHMSCTYAKSCILLSRIMTTVFNYKTVSCSVTSEHRGVFVCHWSESKQRDYLTLLCALIRPLCLHTCTLLGCSETSVTLQKLCRTEPLCA